MGGHGLSQLAGRFAVVRLDPDAEIPAWACAGALSSVTRTERELSVICAESAVPGSVRCEAGFRALRVDGPLPFSAVGVLAALAGPLADAGISILALATHDTDYLLIREVEFHRALATLRDAGHSIDTDSVGGGADRG